MTTNDQTARLAEFREAAAAVRHAWQADTEAREAQILADLKSQETERALIEARERFARAEARLATPAEPATPPPAPAGQRLLIDDLEAGYASSVAPAANGSIHNPSADAPGA